MAATSKTTTLWVRKTRPLLFEHNFGKCCPILIILSLLQREINCDQVYPKIYHHTPNLLVHYLVKWSRMYWPTLLAWFHTLSKDATVSVTDMDKINTVSSQAVLEVSSFSTDTRSMSSSPLVKNRLFKTSPDIDELPFQFTTLWICLWQTWRCMTVHFCSNLFQETFSLVFGAATFWTTQVFDQNLIFVAKCHIKNFMQTKLTGTMSTK